ncbi:hypothetical protein [Lentzea sp. NPDC051838]|uniref:lipase family alpha/beta hydrolase n=1 Tax=Lentzea sp. NPDC051838 TaxID=3154849 RepID=UPI00342E9B0D
MQRLRDLVVVVPGIGGSKLTLPNGEVWEPRAKGIARAVIRPSTLDLERFPELEPVDLIRTFSVLGPKLTVHGYDNLHTLLNTNFRDVATHVHRRGVPIPASTDVLLFPYDFRQSVRDAAERLAAAVHEVLGGESRRRVIVLAHSMGGLVARYWIGPLGGWSVCRALITLGTPHRGAPKALDWLVRGPGFGALRHPSVRKVFRQWPSMYELLPQYPAVWDERVGREIELTALRPSSYSAQFATMAAAGRATHDDIAAAWADIPPARMPDVVPYFGRGHGTPNEVVLRPDGTLDVLKRDPHWRGNVGWTGDGTVPALSAIPRELGETRAAWRGLRERHGPMAHTPSMIELLKSYAGEAVPTRGSDTPSGPWLGIDFEEIVPAGEETQVGVTIQPGGTGAADMRLLLSPSGLAHVPPITMSGAGEVWMATLPALDAGRYRLDFEARQVGGPESVYASADLVVLDAAFEEWS